MEKFIGELFGFSLQPTSYIFLVCALGLLFIKIEKVLTRVKSNLNNKQSIKQWGIIFLLLAKLILMLVLVGFVLTGFGWLWEHFLEHMSPRRLALYSLIIGPAPLLLPMLAKIICKLTGGTVNASQASGCVLLGFNFNPFVHSLFMSYMLGLLAMGIAFLGLMTSAIWALTQLF